MSSQIPHGLVIPRLAGQRPFNQDSGLIKQEARTVIIYSIIIAISWMSARLKEYLLRSTKVIKLKENGTFFTLKMLPHSLTSRPRECEWAQEAYLRRKYGLPKMLEEEEE